MLDLVGSCPFIHLSTEPATAFICDQSARRTKVCNPGALQGLDIVVSVLGVDQRGSRVASRTVYQAHDGILVGTSAKPHDIGLKHLIELLCCGHRCRSNLCCRTWQPARWCQTRLWLPAVLSGLEVMDVPGSGVGVAQCEWRLA